MPYTDQNGLVWTRSSNKLSITCTDGRKVLGNAQMTDEYLVSVAYQTQAPFKTDAERIAELEALVQSLLNK